jgi:hypothetical protein
MNSLGRLAIVALAAVALATAVVASRAQHNHPAEDVAIHEKFYASWMRPDNPLISCCSSEDCYPVAARFRDGNWQAMRREDGKWLTIPANKIERNRDSPDGRNHLCAPTPSREDWVESGVYCFSVGGGA